MKSLRIVTITLLVAALGASGCGKKKETPAASSGSASDVASGSASGSAGSATASGSDTGSGSASDTAAAAANVDVPTEEDFEGDAKSKITTANVEAQVKSLEQDLGQ